MWLLRRTLIYLLFGGGTDKDPAGKWTFKAQPGRAKTINRYLVYNNAVGQARPMGSANLIYDSCGRFPPEDLNAGCPLEKKGQLILDLLDVPSYSELTPAQQDFFKKHKDSTNRPGRPGRPSKRGNRYHLP